MPPLRCRPRGTCPQLPLEADRLLALHVGRERAISTAACTTEITTASSWRGLPRTPAAVQGFHRDWPPPAGGAECAHWASLALSLRCFCAHAGKGAGRRALTEGGRSGLAAGGTPQAAVCRSAVVSWIRASACRLLPRRAECSPRAAGWLPGTRRRHSQRARHSPGTADAAAEGYLAASTARRRSLAAAERLVIVPQGQ